MKRNGKIQTFLLLIRLTAKRFFGDAGPQRAAGLAYSTLMALVPLIGVLIGFGGTSMTDDRVREFLADTMLPAMQEPIVTALMEFAENGTRMGLLGLPLFLITAVFLLNNIETALNHVFRVRTDRDILRRLTTYLGVLVFASLFLGSSISLSGDMLEQIFTAMGYRWFFPLFKTRIASFLFIFLGQILLLTLIPGRRVHLSSALTGAAFGALLWELSKRLFALWLHRSVRLSVIYGSLFILPLLLIWMMLVWIILLLSAELTYVHQNRAFYGLHLHPRRSPGEPLLKALYIYSRILKDHLDGRPPLSLSALAELANLTERQTEELLLPLLEEEILIRGTGMGRQRVYLPRIAPQRQPLNEVLGALTGDSNPEISYTDEPLIRRLREEISACLSRVSAAEAADDTTGRGILEKTGETDGDTGSQEHHEH